MRLGQIVRPLDTVAAYIPSGRYPLPSTILMTVVPAQVAGVPNISVASPRPVAEVFGTAAVLGVGGVFEMGGAQAIAAFAFGTSTVPRADRSVGPGNIYVAFARSEGFDANGGVGWAVGTNLNGTVGAANINCQIKSGTLCGDFGYCIGNPPSGRWAA